MLAPQQDLFAYPRVLDNKRVTHEMQVKTQTATMMIATYSLLNDTINLKELAELFNSLKTITTLMGKMPIPRIPRRCLSLADAYPYP